MNPVNRLRTAAGSKPPACFTFVALCAHPGPLMQGSQSALQALCNFHPKVHVQALTEGIVTGQNGY